MLIVPFIHKVTNNIFFDIHTIRILTVGGKSLWEEPDGLNIDKDILNPSDIYRTKNTIKIDKNIHLCEIDLKKTNMDDIYKWSEIDLNDNETFCWRDYVYMVGKNEESWLNIPKNEKLGNTCVNKILLSVLEKSKKF